MKNMREARCQGRGEGAGGARAKEVVVLGSCSWCHTHAPERKLWQRVGASLSRACLWLGFYLARSLSLCVPLSPSSSSLLPPSPLSPVILSIALLFHSYACRLLRRVGL